jgi:hypothetical protein
MYYFSAYHIEPTLKGQAGWLVKNNEGRTVARCVHKEEAMVAVQELSRQDLSVPEVSSHLYEASHYLG